jgi:DNA (cytosine-5)-methyltransferase 1
MGSPVVLDLFCGGGGAAEGYARTGMTVIGVDHEYQPCYPYEFHEMDAFEAIEKLAHRADFIHASPPCQGYSIAVTNRKRWPKLIRATREALLTTGKPFVIENVDGFEQGWVGIPTRLCGTMFGLPIQRHRLFEAHHFRLRAPKHPKCYGVARRYATENGVSYREMRVTGNGQGPGTAQR